MRDEDRERGIRLAFQFVNLFVKIKVNPRRLQENLASSADEEHVI